MIVLRLSDFCSLRVIEVRLESIPQPQVTEAHALNASGLGASPSNPTDRFSV
jgi:hypothetical protein